MLISWSHADPTPQDHASRLTDVRALADALRSSGIDAEVDLYHLHEGIDWTRWGPRLATEVDYVLIVPGPAWRAAWEGRGPATQHAGAAAETDVLKSIYNRNRDEFIQRVRLVLLPGSSSADIPDGLHGVGRHSVEATDSIGMENLLRDLTKQAKYPLPPLGEAPILPPELPERPLTGPQTRPIQSGSGAPQYVPLDSDLDIGWRYQWDREAELGQASVALHVLPVPTRSIPHRQRTTLVRILSSVMRTMCSIPDATALRIVEDTAIVDVRSEPSRRDYRAITHRGEIEGLRVDSETGQRSVWRALPRDSMGAVLDEEVLREDVIDGLRIAAELIDPRGTSIAIAVEVGPTDLITDGTAASLGRTAAMMPKAGRGPLLLPPDEAFRVDDLALAAPQIAQDLVPSIIRAWTLL